jgi:hypothetical protein
MWFYFRIGYSTYLTFLLGAVNTLVVVWYLALQNAPAVQTLFGHFVPFAIVITVVGTPLSVAIGWAHYKRSPAYTSEIDIQVEANPYNYKLVPGKEQVYVPLYSELLHLLQRLCQNQNILTAEDAQVIDDLERRLNVLAKGGMAGTPKSKT